MTPLPGRTARVGTALLIGSLVVLGTAVVPSGPTFAATRAAAATGDVADRARATRRTPSDGGATSKKTAAEQDRAGKQGTVTKDAGRKSKGSPGAGGAPTAPPKWTTRDFWAFVDRRQADAEPHWRDDLGVYMTPGSTENVRLAANMLTVHADAARAGHQGSSRQDVRVVRLAEALTRAPAFLAPPNLRTGTQAHAPGWSSSTVDAGAQHVALDPQVAGALVAAWEARGVVGMPPEVVDRIVNAIRDVAQSSFFRYPAMMLNQWNWHGDLAAYALRVTGDRSMLDEYRAQLSRFVLGARTGRGDGRTAFFNGGQGLIYSPRQSVATGAALVSSPEYENLIFSGLQHYDWAVSQGMPPLAPEDELVLQQWSQRVLFGDWTHAGALNWDTSLGTRRWHLARYWAFAQQGLGTLATAQRLSGGSPQAAWAAWIAQRSLETYEHYAAVYPSRQLPSGMWGINGREVAPLDDPLLTASRIASTAAELAVQGAGVRGVVAPPGWFALDGDAQRLAVSTRHYSTAVLQAHPTDDYGGVDLARLYNGAGDPVSGTGGGRRSAFGAELVVAGQQRLDTQPGRQARFLSEPTLAVTQNGIAAARGVFDDGLVATGSVRDPFGSIVTASAFDATGITVERRFRATSRGRATVRFPVWGGTIRIIRGVGPVKKKDGKIVRVKGKAVREEGPVEGLLLRAERGGYAVTVCTLPKETTARIVAVPPSTTSTRTRGTALLSFPLAARRTQRIVVRMTPTTEIPGRALLGCD